MTDRYDLNEVLWPDTPFPLKDHMFMVTRRGSEAHGTYIPPTTPDAIDDRDVMAIVIPPRDYYIGLKQWETVQSIKGPWDVVAYELKKFVRMLINQNPNVFTALWLEPEDYLFATPQAQYLISQRNLFRTRTRMYKSFVGYAKGQMHKMNHLACEGYMGQKRKELKEKFGYDTKNASHLIRLLHMADEYLKTGEMHARRTWDREILIDIKTGGWTLEHVTDYANHCFKMCEESYSKSTLPEELDLDRINEMVVEMMEGPTQDLIGDAYQALGRHMANWSLKDLDVADRLADWG